MYIALVNDSGQCRYVYCDLYIVDGDEISVKTSFMSNCKCQLTLFLVSSKIESYRSYNVENIVNQWTYIAEINPFLTLLIFPLEGEMTPHSIELKMNHRSKKLYSTVIPVFFRFAPCFIQSAQSSRLFSNML